MNEDRKAIIAFAEDGVRFVVGARWYEREVIFAVADTKKVPADVAKKSGLSKLAVGRIRVANALLYDDHHASRHPSSVFVLSAFLEPVPFKPSLSWDCGHSCSCSVERWDLEAVELASRSAEARRRRGDITSAEEFAVATQAVDRAALLAVHTATSALAVALSRSSGDRATGKGAN